MVLALGEEDYAPEDHVDGGGHEGRGDEEEDVLNDVRTQCPAAGVFESVDRSGNVTDYFTYGLLLASGKGTVEGLPYSNRRQRRLQGTMFGSGSSESHGGWL